MENYFKKLIGNYDANMATLFENRGTELGNIFFDVHHMNHVGYAEVAKRTFQIIESDLLSDADKEQQTLRLSNIDAKLNIQKEELNSYLDKIGKYKKNYDKIGAIVVNCNPFTLGHKYLIEQALMQVDFLYIFVLEENKSQFSFDERYDMVKDCCKDYDKCLVLPSGKFLISQITFPQYFIKEKYQEDEFNPDLDLDVFGEYIAKQLNITTRFVGEEPNCKVTNRYNTAMKRILSDYGIDVVEVPRKKQNEEVISASIVRKCLKEKNYLKLRELVPESVYKQLLKK